MARLGTRQQILLLVAAASVPVSLGLTAWPPAHVHEIVVVHAPVPVPVEAPAATREIVEVPPAAPAPVEVEIVEAQAQPAGFVYGRDFLWVTHDVEGGQAFAVLSVEPDEAWGTGRPQPVPGHEGMVERTVDAAAVPAELRALVGERVVLDTGAFCTAVVGPMRLVAQVEGELELLAGEDVDLDVDEALVEEHGYDPRSIWERTDAEGRQQMTAAMWEGGRRLLVAPLTLGEACDEDATPRWARPVRRGDVARLEAGPLSRRSALVRRFLALPELVELSTEFDAYVASMAEVEAEVAAEQAEGEKAEGEAVEGASEAAPRALPRLVDRVTGRRWRTAEGTPAFVTMITEGEELQPEPCSGIPVPQWAIAPVDADGKAGAFVVGPAGAPSEILDLDGDGQWELLVEPDAYFTEPQLVTIGAEGFTALTALPSVPFWGCPC